MAAHESLEGLVGGATNVQFLDPKLFRSAVDAIAHEKGEVARHNAKCDLDGRSFQQEVTQIVHDTPLALARFIESKTSGFELQFDKNGHVSGYRTYWLGIFHTDEEDQDLHKYIRQLTQRRVELCKVQLR